MRRFILIPVFIALLALGVGGSALAADPLVVFRVSETTTTITLGWQPVEGSIGYRFSRSDQTRFSSTWDGNRDRVTFGKGADWYRVEALMPGPIGTYPPPAPPPPPPPLPACSNTVDDDGDGLIDFPADPGCASLIDTDEFNAPPPPPPNNLCLVSNRLAWNLAGTNCAAATTINFTNEQFVCRGPLSAYGPLPLRLVWNFSGNPDFGDQGHLSFQNGCRGDGNDDTIDVIVASNANGLTVGAAGGAGKFQTAGPIDIQITGNFDCGPLGSSAAHQDTWQFHPNWPVARLDIVNGTSGNWNAGTSTCIGAGGAIFFSNPYDVDVFGGRYVTCNHGYFGNSTPSNQVVDAGFRTGRVDGTDPKCIGINAGAPTSGAATFTNVIAQRWNATTKAWVDQ